MLEKLQINEDNPNVQEIMLHIRGLIAQEKLGRKSVTSQADRFSAATYDHLFQAMVNHDQARVEAFVSPTTIPIVGPLVQRLRRSMHSLVLFYLEQLSDKQILFNKQLVTTLDGMVSELEAEKKQADLQAEIAALQERVTDLEAQIAHLVEKIE